jgi:hypothetical protein
MSKGFPGFAKRDFSAIIPVRQNGAQGMGLDESKESRQANPAQFLNLL